MFLSDQAFPESSGNARASFLTYTNYLNAFSRLIQNLYPNDQILSRQLKTVQIKSGLDINRIRSLLFNSWNSELLLNFPGILRGDILKFSNHWAPVQSYYAIYLLLRALIVSKKMDSLGDHSTTLNVVCSNFIRGEKLFPLPWSFLYPTNVEDTVANNDNWFSIKLFLKTTRDRIIEEKCKEWKKQNPTGQGKRSRLPPGRRELIANTLRPISVFDFFYRLRIRSNYKDVDIFILGSQNPEIQNYFNSLCYVTDRTLFCIEHYVHSYIGMNKFCEFMTEFKRADGTGILSKLPFCVLKRWGVRA